MFVEGIITPIPSEAIMPFAGSLARDGHFNVAIVIAVGTIGATAGSTIAYYIGYYLGRPFIFKYGALFGIKSKHVDRAESWFERYGTISIFLGHSFPGTRSFISFPAGIAKMRITNFVLFTFLGALIWNSVLTLAGYYLWETWEEIAETFEYLDLVIILAVFLVFIGYLYFRRNRRRDEEE